MHEQPPIRRYHLACPECGRLSLAFYACPGCGHTLLTCEELGTVYADPHDLSEPIPYTVGDPQCLCPGCEKVPLIEFRAADAGQIEAAGFQLGEYE